MAIRSASSDETGKKDILHDGRLGTFAPEAAIYTSSIDIDSRLLSFVFSINRAHVVMLSERRILDSKTASEILSALARVPRDLEMNPLLEDVHMNVENYVISRIGKESGGMLNLAKSRNDQVATAIRMALRKEMIKLGRSILALEKSLLSKSQESSASIMPGYTHLQRGQPVTLGHVLLAHFDSVDRDFQRLVDCYLRMNISPMGAGALGTTSFDIDRERTADLLGFYSVLENSVDAVSSRDFATESIYLCAQAMTDVSSLCEEIILWTTKEFSFAEISDQYSSTSSMMPQKKNAVVPEIFRARTSQVLADLVGALGIVKSLPLSYNLDLQELTRNLWSATDKATSSIAILSDLVRETSFDEAILLGASTTDEFIYATEIADYLVSKFGIPFREAHGRVGNLVRYCAANSEEKNKRQFTRLNEDTLYKLLGVKIAKSEIASLVDPRKVLSRRKVLGSPNPKLVTGEVRKRMKLVSKHEETLKAFEGDLERAEHKLSKAVKRVLLYKSPVKKRPVKLAQQSLAKKMKQPEVNS